MLLIKLKPNEWIRESNVWMNQIYEWIKCMNESNGWANE